MLFINEKGIRIKDYRMTHSGYTIRLSRENRGMTQQEFANKLGVHVQFVSNVERGKCLLPPTRVKKTAKVLNIWMKTIVHDLRKDWLDQLDRELGIK